MKYSRLFLATLIPVSLLILFMATLQTQASPTATFTVNSTMDATDVIPGDGVCETAVGNGVCTLRAAVMEANALSGSDVISLPANTYALTIAGPEEDASATGDIDILDDLTINGTNAATTIVDGAMLDRVFHITGTNDSIVSISNLTVQNGGFELDSDVADPQGGGIYNALPGASLLISDSVLLNNQSFPSLLGGPGGGGGIYNAGALQLSNTDILTNSSPSGHGVFNVGNATVTGGVLAFNSTVIGGGGTLLNQGTLYVEGTHFYRNYSYGGGGVDNTDSGTTTLKNVSIYSNSVYLDGGGILNFGTITVTNSAIYENKSNSSRGGGIFSYRGTFNVISSTIHHNTAVAGFADGGGVYVYDGVFDIKDTAIYSNSAGVGGGIYFEDGALLLSNNNISGNVATTLGGGIYSVKSLSIENNNIADNQAQAGGGVYIDGNILTITNSTIQNNIAEEAAGIGVYNMSRLEVQNSTISHNNAIMEGGGVLIDSDSTSLIVASSIYSNSAMTGGGILNYGQLESINSTVSSNMASQQGGGIWSEATIGTFLENVTLAENSAPSGAGIYHTMLTTTTITHTLLANNGTENCNLPLDLTYFSLEDNNDCGLSHTGDITNTNALLGPLTNNGGSTLTHALLEESPAIDAGDNASCPAIDQRGTARPFDGDDDGTAVCDIGAIEYGALSLQYIYLPQIIKP
ncbi:MAG: hypothetical protein CL608_15020 [Anaerolineaceae bacterium]|nr:hypothetical protein [Anaerolineaceae bacterium]